MKQITRATALLAMLALASAGYAQTSVTDVPARKGSSIHQGSVAEAFIAENITKSLVLLNNPALTEQQRGLQFEALLLSLTDMKRVALFTLGGYAQAGSSAERDAFVAAFQTYSVAVYRSYLSRFSGQTLTVTSSSERTQDDFIVSTSMVDHQGGQPLVVQFRVRTDTGRPVVTDLGVMGVWLAISERDEFASYLGSHGGSIPALTANVQEVAARYH